MTKKANKGRVVFMNGELIPENQANISIYDSALMFGDMIFEMTRSFNKQQFKLREHLERLYSGIKVLRIPLKMTIDEMEKHCYEVIEANEITFESNDEHRLMIDVTRGILGLYDGVVGTHSGPNVIIADFPLRWTVQHNAHQYDEGLEVIIPSQRAIPAELLDPKIKNRSRIHYLMANIEVSNYQGNNVWALLLDTDGYVAEGTGANFFIIKEGVIYTPEARNILRGISRDYIFTLSDELGITCIEKNIELFDVLTADESFFTSTPYCMLPVVRCQGVDIGSGSVGPIFQLLLKTWSKNVGVDIVGQIKQYSRDCSGKRPNGGLTPYSFRN
jgi:branched-chain amino acid aminotransferase